jgi:hypothetical protein
MQDPRAIPALVRAFADAGLKNTSESLVRLKAVERGAIGGLDAGPSLHGHACTASPFYQDWDYLGRTSCRAADGRFELALPVPPRGWQRATLALRASASGPCTLDLGDDPAHPIELGTAYTELRMALTPAQLGRDRLPLTLACEGPLELDHALIVPQIEAASVD